MGRQLVAGRLGPGGARAKGHPTLGLEHPGRGWAEPLGEGGRGGRQKHGGGPPDWSIWGRWPNRAFGLVKPRHTRKAGAGLFPLERGYRRKKLQGRAESIGRRRSEHRGKNGGEGCWGRSRGHAGGRQMRDSPDDQGRDGVSRNTYDFSSCFFQNSKGRQKGVFRGK